ncbi:MAG: hypothetical protein ACYCWE_18830 [Eubacteriales bacterium]
MKTKFLALTLAFVLIFGFSGAVYAASRTIDQYNDGSQITYRSIGFFQP